MAALGLMWVVATAAAPPWRFAVSRAEDRLEQGQWRRAEQDFRDLMRVRPNHRVRIGLARALAMGGDCGEALSLLDGLVGTLAWTVDASLAEARCLQRDGRLHDAIEVYGYAAERVPERVEAIHGLVGVLGAAGEPVDQALDALELAEAGEDLALAARVELALRVGSDELGGLLALARWRLGDGPVLALADARASLDTGDPVAAERVLRAALARAPGHGQLALWRAEALRRTGDPDGSLEILEAPIHAGIRSDALARIVEARVRVDLGQLAEARERLSGLSDPDGSEALASRWYVQRAEGRDVVALARTWRACESSPARDLEQLVPLEAR